MKATLKRGIWPLGGWHEVIIHADKIACMMVDNVEWSIYFVQHDIYIVARTEYGYFGPERNYSEYETFDGLPRGRQEVAGYIIPLELVDSAFDALFPIC
ncbi:hypothetical protein [Mahella australiensis]|uniref:Uncharacterized protein n=1 Tax=Mahella australiensis (strain DSM 15567 / CIP 107919 / 50-1 BON) TaxID=697281 RepID=F3ZXE7_MAHA5|nr:hypothetical protein [Mahella australiensis]AEE97628.1 hypothetical protein Mahau_2470 [Mahella australiensis 50-1 BON]